MEVLDAQTIRFEDHADRRPCVFGLDIAIRSFAAPGRFGADGSRPISGYRAGAVRDISESAIFAVQLARLAQAAIDLGQLEHDPEQWMPVFAQDHRLRRAFGAEGIEAVQRACPSMVTRSCDTRWFIDSDASAPV